ncbi:MAG TPA: MarR family transcriptional regulator, partial [Gemmatimonadales bacterium]|nr:MarR family transcriptional regulator [Gemmatimonadales bacterium]
ELKQTIPFRSAAQEAVLGVMRTADLLQRRFATILGPFGVSPQQYNVLRILRGAGERGLPTLEIGDRMIEQSPGVTRLVDRLIAHGWAERVRCTSDRRVVYCRITPAGLDLLANSAEHMVGADRTLMGALSEPEQRQLIELLDRVRGGEVRSEE